jgi:DNA primase
MNIVDEIKSKVDIVDIAGKYLQLKRSGKNWMTRCPFHEDRNPSLVIFPESQRWKCFGSGCNLGGDVFDLVQRLEKWDFGRALRWLAEKAGVEMTPLSEEEQKRAEKKWGREEVFNAAMAYFQDQLLRQIPQRGRRMQRRKMRV